MRRIGALAAVALVATACSGNHSRTLGSYGVTLKLPQGWYGAAAPGQLQVADFPLPRGALASAERAGTSRGHTHLIVWDAGPAVPFLARNHPRLRGPLALRAADLTGPFEGFPLDHVFARRAVTAGGELLDVLVDLGPKPAGRARLREVNRILATLRVQQPRVVRPEGGLLAHDGVSLRLSAGWHGRIELPADRHSVRYVLRARSGTARVVLLGLSPALQVRAREASLPVALSRKNIVRGTNVPVARRVFGVNSRDFDLSVVFGSQEDLVRANRLLARLRFGR
jgi:hypothetical protein